jgi:hypothetical protein
MVIAMMSATNEGAQIKLGKWLVDEIWTDVLGALITTSRRPCGETPNKTVTCISLTRERRISFPFDILISTDGKLS